MGIFARSEVKEAKKILTKELREPLLKDDYETVYRKVLEGLNLLKELYNTDRKYLLENKHKSAGLLLTYVILASELAFNLGKYDDVINHIDFNERFREEWCSAFKCNKEKYRNLIMNASSYYKEIFYKVAACILSKRFEEGFEMFKLWLTHPRIAVGADLCMSLKYQKGPWGQLKRRKIDYCHALICMLHLLRFLTIAGMAGLLTDEDLEKLREGFKNFGKEIYEVYNEVITKHGEKLKEKYIELNIPLKEYENDISHVRMFYEEYNDDARRSIKAYLVEEVRDFKWAYKERASRDAFIYQNHI